jgi:hypothetical protein
MLFGLGIAGLALSVGGVLDGDRLAALVVLAIGCFLFVTGNVAFRERLDVHVIRAR